MQPIPATERPFNLGKFDHDRTLFSRTLDSWELDSGNHPLLWPQDSG